MRKSRHIVIGSVFCLSTHPVRRGLDGKANVFAPAHSVGNGISVFALGVGDGGIGVPVGVGAGVVVGLGVPRRVGLGVSFAPGKLRKLGRNTRKAAQAAALARIHSTVSIRGRREDIR